MGVDPKRIFTDHGLTAVRGKQPKLSDKQQHELRRMYDTGNYSISDLAELFSISRPTVYRTIARFTGETAVRLSSQ